MEETLRTYFEEAGLVVTRITHSDTVNPGWSVWLEDGTEAHLPTDNASSPEKVTDLIQFLKDYPKEKI